MAINDRIAYLVSCSANGVAESVENRLHEMRENSDEITKNKIATMIESTVELSLSENEWHIQQALLEKAQAEINVEALFNEYGTENEDEDKDTKE